MDKSELSQMLDILQLFEFQRIFFLLLGMALLIYVSRLITGASNRLSQRFPSRRLLILQIFTTLIFALYICGSVMLIYVTLRPPKELLIALGGSAAVAIGFALKDVVASIIAGLILLFDRPFQVGDRVYFGDVYGEIRSIGLRAVRLLTLDENLVTIPNSKFITDHVSSGNSGALDMMVNVDFHTQMDVDIEKVMAILSEVVVTSRFAYLSHPSRIVLSEVEIAQQMALRFSLKGYVLDVKYEKAFQTDLVKRGNIALRNAGIARPLPLTQRLSS